ncbi:hypothetical protein SPI_03161 [Niveomyces insectorum RCEF 264]|uniref:Ubiquitin-like domain-containing protein n=1 Tax=Niveomyces insectorum RCEF 264 TaxID=1081102 RepID=A0A167X4D6_9HYPO|nr:hypothetical protein SPI_03161 [Niveomyces insectorum RCEF 264]
MSHTRTSITTDHRSTGSSQSRSLDDDEETSSHSNDDDYSSSQDNESLTWGDDYGEVEPSDSASASADYPPHGHQRKVPLRNASRRHTRPQRRQSFGYRTIPAPQATMSAEPSEDYAASYGGRASYVPQNANAFYGHPGGQLQQQQHYPQSYVGYMGPPYAGRGGQMVHYNGHQNPFTPMGNGAGANYFGEGRPPYDSMVPYQQNFFGGGPGYAAPVPQYMYANPPPPPPTEAPAPAATPAPPAEKKPDPEMERIKQQLELLQAEKQAKEEEIKRKKIEDQIRQAAELEMERRLERVRKEQELQKKELEKAKLDAERAARERMEAERKADEEKRRQQAEVLARIEHEARVKVEAERRAEEERKKREAEIAAAAEAALKARMEAAEAAAKAKAAADFKAEIEAKEAAERKVKEELEWRKKLEEEAKLKAEIEARAKVEAEKKKEEEAKIAEEEKKKADKAMRDRILEEAKVKLEEAAKKKEKAPIKFKDAVGRKFSFPYHLCQTWQGMEELIKQAFVQVEAIGPHVQEGHYDLIGPNGEIILPSIWEKVVEPDWSITMHMWPMDKTPPLRNPPPGMPGGPIPIGGRHHMHPGVGRGFPMPPMRPNAVPPGVGPPRPQVWGMPPQMMRPGAPMPRSMGPANVVNGDPMPRHDRKKGSSSKSAGAGFLAFMGGKAAKPSKKYVFQ